MTDYGLNRIRTSKSLAPVRHCGELARWAALVLDNTEQAATDTCAPDFRYRAFNGWLITYVSGSVIA